MIKWPNYLLRKVQFEPNVNVIFDHLLWYYFYYNFLYLPFLGELVPSKVKIKKLSKLWSLHQTVFLLFKICIIRTMKHPIFFHKDVASISRYYYFFFWRDWIYALKQVTIFNLKPEANCKLLNRNCKLKNTHIEDTLCLRTYMRISWNIFKDFAFSKQDLFF